jgi:hypothetical protein
MVGNSAEYDQPQDQSQRGGPVQGKLFAHTTQQQRTPPDENLSRNTNV